MVTVAGRVLVNRPFFFTEVDGSRAEFPAFGAGQGDLEGNELRKFGAFVKAKQIEESAPTSGPVNTVAPVLSGTAQVGSVLSVTDGTWTGEPAPTFTRQWKRGTTDIGTGAATYTLVAADAGQVITCVVTATNSAGSTSETSNASAAVSSTPENTVAPVVTGTPQVGQVLTASNGTWTGSPAPTLSHQWQTSDNGTSGWTNISGATAAAYTPVGADEAKFVRCQITGTNEAGTASATSAPVGPIAAAE